MDSTVVPNAVYRVLSMHLVGSMGWHTSGGVAYDLHGHQVYGKSILITQSKFDHDCCKVLVLYGLLTCHVLHAHERYRCRTAVHTASILEVDTDHFQYWSLELVQRQTLQPVFGETQKLLHLVHTFIV